MGTEKKEKQISLRVELRLASQLEGWATAEDLSLADFVRKLLKIVSGPYADAGSLHALKARLGQREKDGRKSA